MSILEDWAMLSVAPARRWPVSGRCSVAAVSAVVVCLASAFAVHADGAAAVPDSAADHQRAAAAMAPYEVFDKVLLATTADESDPSRRAERLAYSPSPLVAGYTAALEALYAAGSAEAAMYAAIIHKRRCRAFKADTNAEAPADAPANQSFCFISAFEKLRFAANAGDPIAMRQLSESYESGYGVPSSTPEALPLTVGSADADAGKDGDMMEQAPTSLPLQKVRLRISSELSGRLR